MQQRAAEMQRCKETNSTLDEGVGVGDDEALEAGSVSGPPACTPPRITRSPTVSENLEPLCPECADDNPAPALNRRQFVRLLGGSAAAVSLGTALAPSLLAETKKPTEVKKPAEKKDSPAETLVKELF